MYVLKITSDKHIDTSLSTRNIHVKNTSRYVTNVHYLLSTYPLRVCAVTTNKLPSCIGGIWLIYELFYTYTWVMCFLICIILFILFIIILQWNCSCSQVIWNVIIIFWSNCESNTFVLCMFEMWIIYTKLSHYATSYEEYSLLFSWSAAHRLYNVMNL